jgi:DNA invertase Pin-like site-specific DNA recombinase
MSNIFGSVAQFEREIMLERQRIGMAKAKTDGKCMGRKPTAFAHAELVRKYADEGLNPTKRVGIGRASVYRILGAEQAHDIKMKDRLSRWGSRKTA